MVGRRQTLDQAALRATPGEAGAAQERDEVAELIADARRRFGWRWHFWRAVTWPEFEWIVWQARAKRWWRQRRDK